MICAATKDAVTKMHEAASRAFDECYRNLRYGDEPRPEELRRRLEEVRRRLAAAGALAGMPVEWCDE